MATRIISAIAAAAMVALAQILAGLSENNVIIVISGALLCVLPYGLWTLLEAEHYLDLDLYLPGVATVVGILLTAFLHWIASSSLSMMVDLLAVLMGAFGSAIIISFRLRQRLQRCPLCRGRLREDSQECPRCANLVCGQRSCWNAFYVRCSDCDWLGRPLFPDDEGWWHERLGSLVVHGRCISCDLVASECTLYKCGQCPWPMCTRCWDRENGRCVRCGWIVAALPESLQAHMHLDEMGRREIKGVRSARDQSRINRSNSAAGGS